MHSSYKAVFVHRLELANVSARVLSINGLGILIVFFGGPAYELGFEVHELGTGFVGDRNGLEFPQARESVATFKADH